MVNFFQSVGQFIQAIGQFIINLIESILTATTIIAQLPPLSVELAGVVPSFLGACILSVVAIGVLKLLVGWGNG